MKKLAFVLSSIFLVGFATAATLPPAEMDAAMRSAGFVKKGGAWKSPCDTDVQQKAIAADINRDGAPEVAIEAADDGRCFGRFKRSYVILKKDAYGRWVRIFDLTVKGTEVLKTENRGFPDLKVDIGQKCHPIWRWNGDRYDIHKKCPS